MGFNKKQYNAEYYANLTPEQRERRRVYLVKYKIKNKHVIRQKSRAWRVANMNKMLLKYAALKAERDGRPFNLRLGDIVVPTYCPVLGIKLQVGIGASHDASPTLDRVDSKRGYVRGNVAVISNRANSIKSNATAAQHRRIADWIDEFHAASQPKESGRR